MTFFISTVQEKLEHLTLAERVETIIPFTYLICFLMAYYGPNGDIIGKVTDTKYYKLEFCWSWILGSDWFDVFHLTDRQTSNIISKT